MGKFFDTENWLWRWMGKIPDFFALSLLWIVCCVPIVTVFPSTIALYDSIAHCVRGDEGGTYRRFFRTFRQELKRGILLSLLWLTLALVLYCGYNAILSGEESNLSSALSLIYLISMAIPLGTVCWLIPLQSRFSYSLGTLHRNALIFAVAHLPVTVIVIALLWGAITLCVNIPVLTALMPGILATLQSWPIEKVLKKYMPEQTE